MGGITTVLRPSDVRVVAVVGCSKNAGKTTTLNAMLADLDPAGPVPGVLSIGIDGEEADFWLGVPKPRVRLRAGSLVATAEAVLAAGSAPVEVLARPGGRTLLGDLVAGRVVAEGTVLLAGIRSKADVRDAVAALKSLGAGPVLVDGAYQRTMAADPEVADGIVVATGAVLGRTVEEVAARTAEVLHRLRLPATGHPEDGALVACALDHRRLAARPASGREPPVVGESPGDPALAAVLAAGPAVVAAAGAVADGLLDALARAPAPVRLVAVDPTRVFATPAALARFARAGHDLRVLRATRVLGVTVNPFSVLGWTLPREALVEAVRAAAPGLPVVSIEVPEASDGSQGT